MNTLKDLKDLPSQDCDSTLAKGARFLVKRDGSLIDADDFPFIPSPASLVLVKTVDFGDTQLKTLNLSPLEIIPTPGPGKILAPVMVMLRALFNTPYDTWPDSSILQFSSGQAFWNINAWDTAATPVDFSSGFNQSGSLSTFTDRAIQFSGDSEAPTGGDPSNILRVSIIYFVS